MVAPVFFVMSDTSMTVWRETIYSLASRYRVPVIYGYRLYVTGGGLMSYGVDEPNMFRGAATYVDRILRGGKPDRTSSSTTNKVQASY